MVVKNIVFYFYVFDGFEDNEAIRLHLKCLKYYSHIFDNALFVISIDDTSNVELIKTAEKAIVDCGFKNIKFKVVENDYYCEAVLFKREIMDRLTEFDGLTFFGHTKGVTNVRNPYMKKESVLKWIAGMYFMNLYFLDEVERTLIKEFKFSLYGSYKVTSDKVENKNHSWYAGTFFWINTNRLANNLKQRGTELPKLHDRGYAEFITGEVDKLGTHNNLYLFPFDYNNAYYLINFLLDENEEDLKNYAEYEKALDI